VGLYFVLALSLLANVYFVLTWQPTPAGVSSAADTERNLTETTVAAARTAGEQSDQLPSTAESAAQDGEASIGTTTEDAVSQKGEVVPEEAKNAVQDVAAVPAGDAGAAEVLSAKAPLPEGARTVRVLVEGPISRGFEKAIGGSGARLAMVASRLLVWNLSLTRDPRKGDTIDLIYSTEEGSETITIHALRYVSKKFSRNFEAYRYQIPGRSFASYFDETGREVPARLSDSPIKEYQEITSLIGDGRGHHGMDFKAPVGTPILAPWDGQIVRTNWNWKYNGNSVELRSHDGRHIARFLHLDKLTDGIAAKARVKKGQSLAKSGNTGRSSAPHLHYEISDGSGRVLNPLEVHDTHHPRLSGSQLEDFKAVMGKLKSRLGS